MVRYFDVIKSGGAKEEEPDGSKKSEKPERPERRSRAVRFSDLEDRRLSIDEGIVAPKTKRDIEQIKKFSLAVLNYIKEVKIRVVDNKSFEIEPALNIINEIINIPDLIKEIYQSSVHLDYEEEYLISRLPNILVCVLKIGQSMGYSKTELLELGLSALLYDVGMFVVPENIIKKEGKLNDYEVSLVRKHVEMGRDILFPLRNDHPWLHRVAYEHHERENGQGYPRGLKGDEICEYAKIVGIIDVYDAMIHNRPHRKAMMQHMSVRELIGSKNLFFSSKIIKVFIKEISIYPVGSYVRLNTKATGVVIDTNEKNPMRPVVELLFDVNGNAVTENNIVKLDENQLIYIVDSVPKEEITSKTNSL
ncbi:MAG: HD domain-containing phosphohydrolase [Syntrophales bacterium]|nr:HD domain-containing phosphohydrolase [Syntrophales bacterium]